MARAFGLAITPWGALGGGVLTGKYHTAPDPTAPPESLDDVVAILRKMYPANMLVATIYTPDEGVTLGGKVIPNLPDSALDTVRPATSTRRGDAYKSVTRTVVPAKRVVQGRQEIMLKVKDRK